MKTLKLETQIRAVNYWPLVKIIALLLLCLLAQLMPIWLQGEFSTLGLLDPSIWQLWLFSMLSFTLLVIGCWYVMHWFWAKIGLPSIHSMVSQFKNLTLWQQFIGYWACFALLFAGALLSLAAIF